MARRSVLQPGYRPSQSRRRRARGCLGGVCRRMLRVIWASGAARAHADRGPLPNDESGTAGHCSVASARARPSSRISRWGSPGQALSRVSLGMLRAANRTSRMTATTSSSGPMTGQELGQQVDRGNDPQDRDQQGHLGAARHVRVLAQRSSRRDACGEELGYLPKQTVRKARREQHHQQAADRPQSERDSAHEQDPIHGGSLVRSGQLRVRVRACSPSPGVVIRCRGWAGSSSSLRRSWAA